MMGLTRSRLVIRYTDGGTTCKRRVNLPSLYTSGGETVYERAQEAFAERGF
ncbi:unknown [Haloarcula marismortui ATCC 43049]|nr:unknown [Haloarcula marismortui ATCC 43049]